MLKEGYILEEVADLEPSLLLPTVVDHLQRSHSNHTERNHRQQE